MVVRGWGGTVATAAGVGVAVGAAQLGLGYGLDIIHWTHGRSDPSIGTTNLSWAVWIAANSVILGAVIAHRLGVDPANTGQPETTDRLTRWLWRPVLGLAAGLGGSITVLLVMLPARTADLPQVSGSLAATAAGYTAAGVVTGVVLAVAALAARPVATNLLATTGWVWLLGVAAVTTQVVGGADPTRIPLGFWETTAEGPWFRTVLLSDAALPLAAVLVTGALAAVPAARRRDHPVGVVLSGGAGPLVLTVAYLVAQPDLTSAAAMDLSRHLLLPYLVLVGVLGALVTSLVRPRPTPPAAKPAPAAPEEQTPDEGAAESASPAEPTDPELDSATEASSPQTTVPPPRTDN